MKTKPILLTILVLAIILLSGCDFGNGPTTPPTDTSVPTQTLTLTATSTISYQPQNSCDNPYSPIRQGATWKYQGTGKSSQGTVNYVVTTTVISLNGDLNTAAAIIENMINNSVGSKCDIDPYEHLECNSGGQVMHMGSDISYTGYFFPVYNSLVPGFSWNYQEELKLHYSTDCSDYDHSLVQTECTVVGQEQVEFLGNPQSALRIDCNQVHKILDTTRTDNYSQTFSYKYSSWYVQGIGMVKVDNVNEYGESIHELTDYSIP